jgi:hypothetical protein
MDGAETARLVRGVDVCNASTYVPAGGGAMEVRCERRPHRFGRHQGRRYVWPYRWRDRDALTANDVLHAHDKTRSHK